MTDPANNDVIRSLLPTKKLVMQLTGFAVGIGLLAWIVYNAIRQGDWSLIAHANPWLVAGILGCTLLSVFLNASIFRLTIQPVKRIPFWDLQRVNVVANMLNYAPVRLGAISRVLYHNRVDGLSLLRIGAWFSLIGYILVLGLASCLLATVARGRIDWIWAGLVVGQLVLGVMAIRFVTNYPLIVRHGRGIHQMVADSRSLWGAVALRMIDLGTYSGRMGMAAAILDIKLSIPEVLVLALVALAASLIPFGRVGFREFCVAATGHQLSAMAGDAGSNIDLLALVESAGEAIVLIPTGAMFLLWYKKRWQEAKKEGSGIQDSGVGENEIPGYDGESES